MERERARAATEDRRGFVEALIGDGRPLITLTGLCLMFSGGFAVFQSLTRHFLPHDVQFLGMTAEQLCALHGCKIVHFMFHDRVAFGGSIMATGVLYLWLAEFPLRQGQAWAWWLLLLDGSFGFGSFLAYLGYGYLDTWHGVATLFLLPCFVLGLVRTFKLVPTPCRFASLLKPSIRLTPWSAASFGRLCLLATGAGMIFGGATILGVGMTCVFVPQDLEFMGLKVADLTAVNPRLVPLIAHDRAGFGGGILSCGWLVLFCVWCGAPSRHLWHALAIAGSIGFACALGVHVAVGYTDTFHLAPAAMGVVVFLGGLGLSRRTMAPTTSASA